MRWSVLGGVALAVGLSSSAFADGYSSKYAPYERPFSWSGFYVGANGGYSWGQSNNDWNIFAPADNSNIGFFPNGDPTTCPPTGNAFCASGSDRNKLNGAIGGVQTGHNWQTGKFLAGVETDFQLSGQKGDQLFSTSGLVNGTFPFVPGSGTVSAAYSEQLEWFGTLRGRVGVTADRVLFYATGGLAYGRVTVDGSANNTVTFPRGPCSTTPCQFPLGSFSNDVTKVGWTLGGGVEAALGGHWSVKAEYLYVDLGTVNTTFATLTQGPIPLCGGRCTFFDAGTGTIHSRITDNIVRVGINYHFGGREADVRPLK